MKKMKTDFKKLLYHKENSVFGFTFFYDLTTIIGHKLDMHASITLC